MSVCDDEYVCGSDDHDSCLEGGPQRKSSGNGLCSFGWFLTISFICPIPIVGFCFTFIF